MHTLRQKHTTRSLPHLCSSDSETSTCDKTSILVAEQLPSVMSTGFISFLRPASTWILLSPHLTATQLVCPHGLKSTGGFFNRSTGSGGNFRKSGSLAARSLLCLEPASLLTEVFSLRFCCRVSFHTAGSSSQQVGTLTLRGRASLSLTHTSIKYNKLPESHCYKQTLF